MDLKISEVLVTAPHTADEQLVRHIKITNTSDDFINNIVLSFSSPHTLILEELVVRERGSLKFTPAADPIFLGNLSPNETAHLYYIQKPLTTKLALSDDIKLSYNEKESKKFSTFPINLTPLH